jgi:hypothetical protein
MRDHHRDSPASAFCVARSAGIAPVTHHQNQAIWSRPRYRRLRHIRLQSFRTIKAVTDCGSMNTTVSDPGSARSFLRIDRARLSGSPPGNRALPPRVLRRDAVSARRRNLRGRLK